MYIYRLMATKETVKQMAEEHSYHSQLGRLGLNTTLASDGAAAEVQGHQSTVSTSTRKWMDPCPLEHVVFLESYVS